MTPRHHLDSSTIIGHASGALSPELSAIVATHLEGCAECRQAMSHAERVGGLLVDQQQSATGGMSRHDRLRDAMLKRLEQAAAPVRPAEPVEPSRDPDRLPAPLHPYFGSSYRALKWRWMGPGMRYIRTTGPSGGTLLMLKIAAGKHMPMHSHGGTEITQILRGAYDDDLGHFAAGDVADLDSEVTHQPVTSAGVECICVAALDAPLRFPGWFARKLQPIFGI
ncbi:MAG: cupin domain-containing protein [Rhodanobacteraceae bacterium]|nr:ChrR family anti-sigma-E factor [Xanthomonadales bacterium]MCP5477639.1 cupin domain-containing protein [Rhodanobacteraceae bacterium]HPF74734.1 ChrR family anti-sigma-E factor [Xanthomonadaceae bacterium]HRY01162.1 ChrR family anti-sigma-E factor [Xanthomonadaceae bacterium]